MVTVRAPTELVERYQRLAEEHGRSRHAELLLALTVWEQMSTLSGLDAPGAETTMTQAEHAAATAWVDAGLRRTLAAGLRRPRPPSIVFPSREASR